VAPYTGSPGAAAYSLPDSTQAGTSTTYSNERTTIVQDALSNATTSTSSVVCSAPGTQDGACYLQSSMVDALGHQSSTLTDAFGRAIYDQLYTGQSPATYAVSATTTYTYNGQGKLVQILQPDGTTTSTFQYDAVGRQIGMVDPDRGTALSLYDADGNRIESMDARGSAGTVYAGYDALNRQLWRNTSNSPTGAYVTYTYDGTVPSGVSCSGITPASNALGHATTEQFTSGPNNRFSGAYCYSYDARGELSGEVDTLAGTTFAPILSTYNDAGMPLQLTYPTAESVLNQYSATGALTSITYAANGTTHSLVPSITYNGAAGAAGEPDSYVVGGTGGCSADNGSILCAQLSYDGDLRPTQATFTQPTSSTPITDYSLGITYDAVGQITSLSSGIPAAGGQSGGQDTQQFCYDEQDRLTWAGNSGTNPCTGQAVTGTTLPTGSAHTASYQYDVLGRISQSTLAGALSSNPQGAYTYDSQHPHAVDAIGSSSYTAQYDALGNMTCRAPTGTQACTSSSQTGAHLTYDAEGRLIQWVSADGSTTAQYGYDGEGNRFEMQVTSGGTTTTTTYLGNLEEVQSVSGGASTTSVSFYGAGGRVAEEVNGHWYYPIGDQLGSTTVMVDETGVIATQLFGPYGQVRWAGGTMPTSSAFTGQRSDSATGLDYYGARYYDPQAGQFTSADTILDGLDRYAYVGGDPIGNVDPSGHDGCDFFCQAGNWFNQNVVQPVKNIIQTAQTVVQGVTQFTGTMQQCLSNGVEGCGQQLVNNAEQYCSNDPAACAQNAISVANTVEGNLQAVASVTGVSSLQGDANTIESGNTSTGQKVQAAADFLFNEVMIFTMIAGEGLGDAAELGDAAVIGDGGDVGDMSLDGACGLSFSADTPVATPTGEEAISSLKVGDQVLAYDPQTHQTTTQTVQHLFINHDTDLVDVKLRTETSTTAPDGAKPKPAANGQVQSRAPPQGSPSNQQAPSLEETLHTTAKHPFLTREQGWVQAGQLQPGMHVIRADGRIGVVEAVQVTPGAGTRYDLTVSNVHTFEVGVGQWVVHNCGEVGSDTTQFDDAHILEGHSQGTYNRLKALAARGNVDAANTLARDTFFAEDDQIVLQRVRQAFANNTKASGVYLFGGERYYKWIGTSGNMLIGGYYNIDRDLVDTAFPVIGKPGTRFQRRW
jgi:RHS repeat-associated protein